MLDGYARPLIDPALDAIGARLARAGVTANAVTYAACAVGVLAAVSIAFQHFWLGLCLILLSRLGDGLDGAVAKRKGATDFGGYLDIVLDFVFYGAIPLGFILADPAVNAVPGAVLLLTFYVNGATVLAYSSVAEKRDMPAEERGRKSLFFSTGLMEAAETYAFFCAFCVFPSWFPGLAYVFATLTAYTSIMRIRKARADFR